MSSTVEILCIGNELLLGNTVNTNASWIARHVTSLGGKVTRITTVADNLDEISRAIREAIRRKPNFLITTGGIGPTFDDMTLMAVARALSVPIKLDKAAAAMIREHYARSFPKRRISLTKPRLKMASIPSGGMPIPNPVGTAPGVRLNLHGIEIFCLPGVPQEARAIFRRFVSKAIRAKTHGMAFVEKWVTVQGAMESWLAPIIDRVMRRSPGVYIKSHPRGGEGSGGRFIELHFSIFSSNREEAEKILLGAISNLIGYLKDSRLRISSLR